MRDDIDLNTSRSGDAATGCFACLDTSVDELLEVALERQIRNFSTHWLPFSDRPMPEDLLFAAVQDDRVHAMSTIYGPEHF